MGYGRSLAARCGRCVLTTLRKLLNREEPTHGQLLKIILQSRKDLRDKEAELQQLLQKLEVAREESVDNESVMAHDAILIMQLTNRLETSLADNGDLRKQIKDLTSAL